MSTWKKKAVTVISFVQVDEEDGSFSHIQTKDGGKNVCFFFLLSKTIIGIFRAHLEIVIRLHKVSPV